MKIFKKSGIYIFAFVMLYFLVGNCAFATNKFDKITHIHSVTGTLYDEHGFDIFGYDKNGYTIRGFGRDKLHKITHQIFSDRGYDIDGYSTIGAYSSEFGFFITDEGFSDPVNGYNSKGFNLLRKHKLTNTYYDPDGYNAEGFDKNGIHRDTMTKWSLGGFDIHGKNKKGIFVSQYHKMRV